MADQVSNVVGVLLNTLSAVLIEEGKRLSELEQELLLIKYEFSHMKAFLESVDLSQCDDPQLKVWIKQVREVSYEIEDVVDEYTFISRPRQGGLLGYTCSNLNSIKHCLARRRLAIELQNIKAKLKTISEARLSYELKYANKMILTQSPAKDAWRGYKDDEALYAKDTQLVGIEKPKQDLISLLLRDGSHLQVITILGMGGIGKTTLAKKVYDDVLTKSRFPVRAWIAISQAYDMEKVLKSIITELCDSSNTPYPLGLESMDTNKLKHQMQTILGQARYVIVLDDVWDENFWDALKFALPENSHGGNHVLLTTRVLNVASASCSDIYRMEPLGFEESWNLFCHKAFRDKSCPAHLKKVVERILVKCGGLPLAIVAIGGVLAAKDLRRLDLWELALSRLGNESEGIGKMDMAKRILRLSYDDLSSNLKSCFLFMAIYREDEIIGGIKLIEKWLAEKFVEQRAGMDIEEVACTYLKELSNRNLIIVRDFDLDGLPLSFRIHDLLRELIIYESREINLITVFDSLQHTGFRWPSEKVVRRLALRGENVLRECVNQENYHHFSKVRSIMISDCHGPIPKAFFAQVLSSKFLKVLSIDCRAHLDKIPHEVFKLYHLTHLNLCDLPVKKVPKSIRRLPNLENLNLTFTKVRKLPKQIQKLQKLQVISVSSRVHDMKSIPLRNEFKAPCNLGMLPELRVLRDIDVSDSETTKIVNDIGKLTQLKDLGVTNLRREHGKDVCSMLENLPKLRYLYVTSLVDRQCGDEVTFLDLNHPISAESLQQLSELDLVGRLEKVPSWVLNIPKMIALRLCWSSLRDDPLETVQLLPNLVFLTLNRAYEGESLCFKAGCFLKLKVLKIQYMEDLRWMSVEKGAMPCIGEMILDRLPLFEEVPHGIEHLRQLQHLRLYDMSDKFKNKLSRTSEDYTRIAHIPQLTISDIEDGYVMHHITTSEMP